MESFISLGRLHIPIFGIFAALGLMCSMALGLRTAVLAQIDPDAFWDLSFTSIIAAFVISRAVLVIENLTTFLHFPMAVLELPTLTKSGMYCTLIFSLVYMRHKKLPLLGVLDAAAPCSALLMGFLSLGLWADGTREGVPTTLPWAVGSSFGRVHPVELYAALVWPLICIALMLLLVRHSVRGKAAGYGLVLAGLANALFGFFRLPNMLYGDQTLDPLQWRGIAMIVVGSLLLAWRFAVPERSRSRAGEELSSAF